MTATKKRKGIFLALPVLALLFLISTSMMSGTFARYTSELAGQDTALVAKWSFDVTNGTDSYGDTTKTLQLFDHEYANHINTTADDGSGEQFVIAPGVGDSFIIDLKYNADVDAEVTINFDKIAGSANVPILYSVDSGAHWITLDNLASALAQKIDADSDKVSDLSGTTFVIEKTTGSDVLTINETVQWKWAFDTTDDPSSNDTVDTTLGNASAANANHTKYGIEFSIKADQVQPTT